MLQEDTKVQDKYRTDKTGAQLSKKGIFFKELEESYVMEKKELIVEAKVFQKEIDARKKNKRQKS